MPEDFVGLAQRQTHLVVQPEKPVEPDSDQFHWVAVDGEVGQRVPPVGKVSLAGLAGLEIVVAVLTRW